MAGSEAWQQLSRDAVDKAARHIASRHTRLLALLQEVALGHAGAEDAAEGQKEDQDDEDGEEDQEEEEEEEDEEGY